MHRRILTAFAGLAGMATLVPAFTADAGQVTDHHSVAAPAPLALGPGGGPPGTAVIPQPKKSTLWLSPTQAVGNGSARSYVSAVDGKPVSIGLLFSAAAMQGLPQTPATDREHCWDVNGDGALDDMTECVGGYELRFPFPSSAANAPYQFFMFNWNPMGHTLPIYPKQHFDFHFYTASQAETDAIRMGPCSELINCDDFLTAIEPLEPQYMPAGYTDVQGAEGMMGDHMADLSEAAGPDFTKVFIYGKYDAKLTFLEPMITRDYILSLANKTQAQCTPIKQPQAWQQRGWYPSRYCVRYHARAQSYAVALEDFRRG